MANSNTGIGWTNKTWNPSTGCSKVSEGCRFCYAEKISLSNGWTKKDWTAPNAAENVALHTDRLEQPLHWKKPCMIFVNSMSDLFHELIPTSFIDEVWDVMKRCPQHTFQVLTKRPSRMLSYMQSAGTEVLPNVWLGTSIEDNKSIEKRLPFLVKTPAVVRFVSAEPLLEIPSGLKDYMPRLQWVIAGGESGFGCREMPEYAPRYVRELCKQHRVPFFFKQWGGHPDKRDGNDALLDGRLWQEYPVEPPKDEPKPEPPKQMRMF